MADPNATLEEKVGNLAQAQAKAVVKPDGMANDFDGELVAGIEAFAHKEKSG